MQSQLFADKLTLVLKTLSMTRSHLAAELAVDKSIVGRWMTGRVEPSNHNMARLTELVASRVPGFRLIDWERDIGGLEALLGVAPLNTSLSRSARLPPGLPIPLMDQIIDGTTLRAHAYEGFFRSTRPYVQRPGHFIHDQIMMRLDATGPLRLIIGTGGVTLDGWVMPYQGKLFVIGTELTSGALGFSILNGVNTIRAGTLDGILLNCALDAGHSPTACAIIMERTGDLSGDVDADDQRIKALMALDPYAPGGSVPEGIVAHLVRDIGPTQLALGGTGCLACRWRGPWREASSRAERGSGRIRASRAMKSAAIKASVRSRGNRPPHPYTAVDRFYRGERITPPRGCAGEDWLRTSG